MSVNFPATLAIIGLIFAFIGGLILAFTLFKAKDTIDEMSKTYWDFNPPFRNELWKERNRALWGILFLVGGFLLQLISYILQIWL